VPVQVSHEDHNGVAGQDQLRRERLERDLLAAVPGASDVEEHLWIRLSADPGLRIGEQSLAFEAQETVERPFKVGECGKRKQFVARPVPLRPAIRRQFGACRAPLLVARQRLLSRKERWEQDQHQASNRTQHRGLSWKEGLPWNVLLCSTSFWSRLSAQRQ